MGILLEKRIKNFEEKKKKLIKEKKGISQKGFIFIGDFKLIKPEETYYRNIYKKEIKNLIIKKITWFGCIDENGKRRLFEIGTEFECVGEYKMTLGKFIK